MDSNREWGSLIVKDTLLIVDVNEYIFHVLRTALEMGYATRALASVPATNRSDQPLLIVQPVQYQEEEEEESYRVLAIVQAMECVWMVCVIVLVAGETVANTQQSIEANAQRCRRLTARRVWRRLELGVSGVAGVHR
jgi:hypothetical protein